MKKRVFILISFLLFLSCVKKPTGPRLKFMEKRLDLGVVEQGKIAKKIFQIKNTGDADLEIRDITTTCGCTAAIIDKKVIPLGKIANIEVSIDTSGKRNSIEKEITITTNEAGQPEKQIIAFVKVSTQAHPDFDVNKSVFSDKCAKCHVGNAAQYKGFALYMEICSMCHGSEGEGGSGNQLNDPDYLSSVDDDYLRRWIAEGELGTSMPAYSKKKNGPLTDEQIDSLVGVIRSWE
jgi:mono/diheme cytochrome c family protein